MMSTAAAPASTAAVAGLSLYTHYIPTVDCHYECI